MSFSSDVKAELCAVADKAVHCRRAELAAMLLFGGNADETGITVRAERSDVMKRLSGLVGRLLGQSRKDGKDSIFVPFSLLGELGMSFDGGDVSIDEEIFDSECCKRAFFRGAFLMAGTVSDPKKDYRIELFAYNETVAALASEMLENFGLSPKSAVRKNYFIIYLENYESVCDSLTIMGAQKAMLALACTQVEKDISNRENRRSNCFIANMDKAMTASARQCAAIDELARTGALENLSDSLKAAAYARAENPEMSLKELSEKTGISKSTLNRRLNKLLESLSRFS